MYMFLLLILFGLACFHIITRYGRKGRLLSKIPGLPAKPFLGNMLYFHTDCLHEIWIRFRRLNDKYYPITRIWYASTAAISIRHPDDLEIILTNQTALKKGFVYECVEPWLKTGILTSFGEKWRQRRKMLTPAFHFSILKKYANIVDEKLIQHIKNLEGEGEKVVKELAGFTSNLTLNIICEAAMGTSLDCKGSEIASSYKKAVHDFSNVISYRFVRPYILNWMMLPIWKMGLLQKTSLKILFDFTEKVISERRAYHESKGYKYLDLLHDVKDVEDNNVLKKKLPMLDHLLAAERKGLIDKDGIREEVDTFTFAGHDTTGVMLTYFLILLAEHKDIQDRVRAEVTEVIDRHEGKLEMSDLTEFTYLERCIKESLRLYPPVSTILRCLPEDLQLKHALAPAGVDVIINIFDVHRDPNFWPNPDKFDPDRFLPENSKNRHPFAYIPFSAGPRNCIGQKFALMEIKIFIARLLYNFYLEPINTTADIKLKMEMVITPRDPLFMRFIKIHKEKSF